MDEFIKRHGFEYAIIVKDGGNSVTEYGDKKKLHHDGIIEKYFLENPAGIFGFLEGQILPKMVSQDDVVVLITQIDGAVIGLATHRYDDIVSRYKWSNEVNESLKEFLTERGRN